MRSLAATSKRSSIRVSTSTAVSIATRYCWSRTSSLRIPRPPGASPLAPLGCLRRWTVTFSRISAAAGMVEISDHADGRVLARVRHMSDLRVQVGQSVAYGQTLGVQDNLG